MSLIMPIMVNDKTIGSIVIHRTTPRKLDKDQYVYDYEVKLNRPDGNPELTARGQLKHNYSDGALELIRKVADKVTLEQGIV